MDSQAPWKKVVLHPGVVWPLLVLVPPIGIGLLWWGRMYAVQARIGITIGSVALFAFYAVMAHLEEQPGESNSKKRSKTSSNESKTSERRDRASTREAEHAKAIKCARDKLKKARKLQRSPSALDAVQEAATCAAKAVALKEHDAQSKELAGEAEKLQAALRAKIC